MNWNLAAGAALDLSYVWQQSRNQENDKALTYTPEHKFKATLNWALPTKTRTETTVTSVSRQFSDLENIAQKKVDGYTTVDLKIIQPIHLQRSQWELFVHLVNLLDEDYQVHYGYPDDGFRVTVGATVEF